MGFVQHHNVVEALAAEGADETFHVGILPRGPMRRLDFMDPHGLDAARERDPVHRIAIAQEVAVSQGNASTSCWAVHWAVGVSATLM
jgi:hypothetical protein